MSRHHREAAGANVAAASPASACASFRDERGHAGAKRVRVIRVPVPIDIRAVCENGSFAFALATPLRVDRLLSMAVLQALGARAPHDKRERSIRATLEGFRAGRFVVDVDGRAFDRADAVVMCRGFATLRFFSTAPARTALPRR